MHFLFKKVPTVYFSVIKCLVGMSVLWHIEYPVIRQTEMVLSVRRGKPNKTPKSEIKI